MRTSLRWFSAIIALSLVGSALCALSPYQVVKPDPQAVAVATKFLSEVDAGNYTETFAMFPARIRSGGDAFEKNWVSSRGVGRRFWNGSHLSIAGALLASARIGMTLIPTLMYRCAYSSVEIAGSGALMQRRCAKPRARQW